MRLPSSVKNWTSLAGGLIALISLFMILFLFIITAVFEQQGAYLGLVVFILLPGILVMGLILIPIGMWLKSRRERRTGAGEPGWPRVDLNDPHHRNAAFIFVLGTAVLLLISAVGSYQAYHFTESVQFCGTICHTVMEPQHVAHQESPHARVACVACHVGPGADWYVRSKLSGLYQVYAVLADVYPRPIPTPIENLRPARAVCEQCHWPEKFYANIFRTQSHFLSDEENTRWDIGLTLKVGDPHIATGYEEGIHWHIHPEVVIEYLPADERRLEISQVRFTNLATGEEKTYRNRLLGEEEAPEGGQMRFMDCIDCHNRPSHRYNSPMTFVNTAMVTGAIPADLPAIKRIAVEVCAEEYPSREAALAGLREGIVGFYRKNYPQILDSRPQDVERAVQSLQSAFARNIFPATKTRWSEYPEHAGHFIYPGCFRCHHEEFTTDAGEAIRSDCNLCHLISMQGTPDALETAPFGETLEFRHPTDIGEMWRQMPCSDCHTGLLP